MQNLSTWCSLLWFVSFFTELENMKLRTNRKEWKESPDSPLLRNERIVKNHLCVVVVERTNLKTSRWLPEICFKQVGIKLCQIWQNGLWAIGWIVVLQCIAMILLNVIFHLHFALVFYETPERGKLAHRVESCWRSSDRWRWFLLPLKVLKLALEGSWKYVRTYWSHFYEPTKNIFFW